jgi:OmpA-OmpF porin, OOP family
MKKIAASLLLLTIFAIKSNAQTTAPVLKKSIGFSFIANDYITAERIRSTSLSSVLRDDRKAKLKEMGHGFAVHYIKGFTSNIDFAATLGGSFVRFSLPGKNISSNRFLAELDASAHFKMFKEGATFNPYLIAGIGASKYTNVYGAFMPLGGGVNINLFNEAKLFTQLQYRVPVIADANKHHFQVSFGVAGYL